MSLQLEGTIKTITEVESGISNAGKPWQKQNFVIEVNNGEYTNDVCFEVFGEEKVKQFNQYNKQGDHVNVSFNLQSRESNGRYYNSIRAWKVQKV